MSIVYAKLSNQKRVKEKRVKGLVARLCLFISVFKLIKIFHYNTIRHLVCVLIWFFLDFFKYVQAAFLLEVHLVSYTF